MLFSLLFPFITFFRLFNTHKLSSRYGFRQNLLNKHVNLNSKDYVYYGQITPFGGFNESHSSVLSQGIAYALLLLLITTCLIIIFYFKYLKRCTCIHNDSLAVENEATTLKDSILPP